LRARQNTVTTAETETDPPPHLHQGEILGPTLIDLSNDTGILTYLVYRLSRTDEQRKIRTLPRISRGEDNKVQIRIDQIEKGGVGIEGIIRHLLVDHLKRGHVIARLVYLESA
jgi:hypothetical protein